VLQAGHLLVVAHERVDGIGGQPARIGDDRSLVAKLTLFRARPKVPQKARECRTLPTVRYPRSVFSLRLPRALLANAAALLLAAACGSGSSAPMSQCEATCNASCQRAQECTPGSTADCTTACKGACNGSIDDPTVNTAACVSQIHGLSCDQIRQVANRDESPLMGKCGGPAIDAGTD